MLPLRLFVVLALAFPAPLLADGNWDTLVASTDRFDFHSNPRVALHHFLLPNGERYIGEAALLERRIRKVPVSEDHHYGMGLMVDEYYGTPVVHHGGDLIGYHSDMMWLPEHGVGAVVLTNGDPGWLIRSGFRRKLLEVLFDGKAEADAQLKSASETYKASMAKESELLDVPAAAERSGALAGHYRNAVLGDIRVQRADGVTTFDFGEWRSEVGSRQNPDGVPGLTGLEFVVGEGEEKTLIMRDAHCGLLQAHLCGDRIIRR